MVVVVMTISEGQVGELTTNATKNTPTSLALVDAWQEVSSVQREMLDSITFADLVTRVRGQTENMYYI